MAAAAASAVLKNVTGCPSFMSRYVPRRLSSLLYYGYMTNPVNSRRMPLWIGLEARRRQGSR